MDDGARTRDSQGHNLVLCQLSYIHRFHAGNTGAAGSHRVMIMAKNFADSIKIPRILLRRWISDTGSRSGRHDHAKPVMVEVVPGTAFIEVTDPVG